VIFSFVLFSILLLLIPQSVTSQDSSETESAQVAISIDGSLPSVSNENWTSVDIILYDQFGIDWDYLITPKSEGGAGIKLWQMKLVWPITLRMPDVGRFLGHTSIELNAKIVGDNSGWEVHIPENVIVDANPGKIYNRTIKVKTNKLAADYSATVEVEIRRIDLWGQVCGISYTYIPVKASPFNFLTIKSVKSTIKAAPKSVAYFQIDITNEGYYEDIFQFDIKSNDGLTGIANEQTIDLKTGETKRVTIGILTNDKFYDPGTPHTIDIYAYSTGDPTPTLVGSVILITEGFYISPLIGIILAPIIILLIIIYFIFFYLKQKKDRELFGKPEKPWNIPIERRHLEELKQKDKEAYEKERLMMEDEYKSAMLWYDSYRQSIKQEKQIEKSKQFNSKENEFFKKPENKKVKPEKKVEKPKEKKPVKKVEKPKEKKVEKPKETPEIVKEQYKAIQKRSAESERRKQIALEKIKRAQEKQKIKIKK